MLAIVHAQTNNFVGIGDRRPQFQRVERQEPTPGLELRLRPGKDLQERLLPCWRSARTERSGCPLATSARLKRYALASTTACSCAIPVRQAVLEPRAR